MLSKGQAIIQGTYLFLYVIMSIGIAGNIELGIKTSTKILIVYGIVCFFVAGKFIYWIKKGRF